MFLGGALAVYYTVIYVMALMNQEKWRFLCDNQFYKQSNWAMLALCVVFLGIGIRIKQISDNLSNKIDKDFDISMDIGVRDKFKRESKMIWYIVLTEVLSELCSFGLNMFH